MLNFLYVISRSVEYNILIYVFWRWPEFGSGNKNIIFKVFEFYKHGNEINSSEDKLDFSLLNNEIISIC